MKTKKILAVGAWLVVSIFFSSICVVLAAEGVLISDIRLNPSKYYNLPVRIKGVVVDVAPEQPGLKSGIYTLRDDSEQTIDVKTDLLPAPGESFIVEGIVTMKPGSQMPFVRELKRNGGGILPIIVIGAAVIVLILIGVLVYMLRRPAVEPAYEAGGIEPTRPLSAEEIKRVAPPERTVEVPSVPAQLEVLNGPNKGERYILKRHNVIGRGGVDLSLGDPTVSAEHAHITFKNRRYILTNKSQTNPTKVNKVTVETRALKDGDEIVMGAIKLRFTKL